MVSFGRIDILGGFFGQIAIICNADLVEQGPVLAKGDGQGVLASFHRKVAEFDPIPSLCPQAIEHRKGAIVEFPPE